MDEDRGAVGQHEDRVPPAQQEGTDSGTDQAPEPVGEAPQPVGEAPQPVGEAPQPVGEAPQPVGEAPQPVGEAPQPAPEAGQEPQSDEPAAEAAQPAAEEAQPGESGPGQEPGTAAEPGEPAAEEAQPEAEETQPAAEETQHAAQEAQPAAEAVEAQPAADQEPEPAAEEARKPKPAAEREPGDTRPRSIEDLKPGMQLKGKVRNVVDFGAFVDIGVGRDGLAHISTLKRAGIDRDVKVGDEIDVVVRRVDLDNNRISLTVPRAERAVKSALRDLEVGSVVTGRVMRLVDFGAFVDIGAPTDGLLHISQLPGGYVNHPSEALKVGDELKVRILEVDPERRRISLSMKDVDSQPPRASEPESAPEEDQPSDGAPTAFEVAFQQALAERRRRRQRQ